MAGTPKYDRQAILAAAQKHAGNVRAVAKELGCAESTVRLNLQAAGEKYGNALHPAEAPAVIGASTLYGKDGEVVLQWVKTRQDEQRRIELAREFIASLAEGVRGVAKPVKLDRKKFESELLCAYGAGDPHFGMRAWADETGGANFDLNIASDEFKTAVSHLIDLAPNAEHGMFIDVGDTTHADSRKNVTPQSGHSLDTDSRYQKVVRTTAGIYRFVIDAMLRKHKTVDVIVAPGNHSPDTAGWLSFCLSLVYEKEPRVRVNLSPSYYLYHRFGKCLIGVTHGDKAAKFRDLAEIMAADRARDWGETQHRFWFTGHIHHEKEQEFRGCVVRSLNTLAPADSWNAEQGYRSRRQMTRFDMHKDHGEVGRGVFNVGMVK
jgi:transposase-like protein